MIELASWDTEHFGLKVGYLKFDTNPSNEAIQQEMEIAKCKGYDVLYLMGVNLPDNILNENFVHVGAKVEYTRTVHTTPNISNIHVESILHNKLDARLLSMALQSGAYSRFYTDKKFPLNVFLTLYMTWITDSLSGKIATDVIAYIDNNRVEGFITYAQKGNQVAIGLLDVEKEVKCKGIGSILVQSLISRLPIGTKISVATQSTNTGARHFYEKNGFLLTSVTNIYHIWL